MPIIYWNVSNWSIFFSTQKYHDFVEVATESIIEYTKTVGNKEVPSWNREEVDEIVTAQVTRSTSLVNYLICYKDWISKTVPVFPAGRLWHNRNHPDQFRFLAGQKSRRPRQIISRNYEKIWKIRKDILVFLFLFKDDVF